MIGFRNAFLLLGFFLDLAHGSAGKVVLNKIGVDDFQNVFSIPVGTGASHVLHGDERRAVGGQIVYDVDQCALLDDVVGARVLSAGLVLPPQDESLVEFRVLDVVHRHGVFALAHLFLGAVLLDGFQHGLGLEPQIVCGGEPFGHNHSQHALLHFV